MKKKKIEGFTYLLEPKQKVIGIICDSPSKVSFIFKANFLSENFSSILRKKSSEKKPSGVSKISFPQRVKK